MQHDHKRQFDYNTPDKHGLVPDSSVFGRYYTHFQTGVSYQVIGTHFNSGTDEWDYTYRDLVAPELTVFSNSIKNFLGTVEHNGSQVPRFVTDEVESFSATLTSAELVEKLMKPAVSCAESLRRPVDREHGTHSKHHYLVETSNVIIGVSMDNFKELLLSLFSSDRTSLHSLSEFIFCHKTGRFIYSKHQDKIVQNAIGRLSSKFERFIIAELRLGNISDFKISNVQIVNSINNKLTLLND